ncbi:MAG: hypothetical protein COB53_10320 [Elusimicrobia bacterium]|nr:MAG: hypothetical protein COB53_10320 [Elusimicrobiota bacterium]
MKSRETFNKVLASLVAVALSAAPAAAVPIAKVSVTGSIGVSPVGTIGTGLNVPGMNFSPMGANINAPTIGGGVLPGLQTQAFGTTDMHSRMAQVAPQYMPTSFRTSPTQMPTLPPAKAAIVDSALVGRLNPKTERGSVATVNDLQQTDIGPDGLPEDMGGSLLTVRGKRNSLGLHFTALRKAFGMPVEDAAFSPQVLVGTALEGRDAGSVSITGSSSRDVSRSNRVITARSYLARAVARMAGLVQKDSGASSKAVAPSLLGVNFSMDRLAVTIFGGSPSALNAADKFESAPTVARDRVIRVTVPSPGFSTRASVKPSLDAASPTSVFSAAVLSSPLFMRSALLARRAVVNSMAGDAPLRVWLKSAVARVNAAAASGLQSIAFSFGEGASRRTIVVPLPSMTARAASGWSAWFSSLVLPLTAMYVYFADQVQPRMALAPVSAARPRA